MVRSSILPFSLRALKILTPVFYTLLFFLPLGESFYPEDNKPEIQCWHDSYLLDSLEMMIILFPFVIFYLPFLLIKRRKVKLVISGLLLAYGGWNLLFSLAALLLPAQDFVAGYGSLMWFLFSASLMPDPALNIISWIKEEMNEKG